MKALIFLLILIIFIPFVAQAEAQTNSFNEMECLNRGDCTFDQGIQYFVNLITWGLGILGSIALLTFILGGFYWLTSGGVAERVQKGKTIIINSIIGMVIVFVAYTAVNFLLTTFGSDKYDSLERVTQTYNEQCVGLPDESSCGGYGVCRSGVCIEKCAANQDLITAGYSCVNDGFSECDNKFIKPGLCFPPSDRLCCIRK
jgi:hypothetical protein